jgi:hypothetical protein
LSDLEVLLSKLPEPLDAWAIREIDRAGHRIAAEARP